MMKWISLKPGLHKTLSKIYKKSNYGFLYAGSLPGSYKKDKPQELQSG